MQSGTNVSSNLVGSLILKNGTATYSSATYGYDALGNITSITDSYLGNRAYTYDAQGQMLTETRDGTTYTYTYDTYGNIRSVKQGSTTIGTYTYETSGWLDKLTAYNGDPITYDGAGNPTTWPGITSLTWNNGKQLTGATVGNKNLTFTYDVDGLRLTKYDGSYTHNYIWQGDRLVSEYYNGKELEFFYDESGTPYAFDYNGTIYYYITNLQGDVIVIVNSSGGIVATYKYDAWGKLISDEPTAGSVGAINPLRYRGYYFDTETGLYYLQSRYYDPEVCRFINADEANNLAANGDYASLNLFAYCGNNPVARADDGGAFWNFVAGAVVGAFVGGITTFVGEYRAAKESGQQLDVGNTIAKVGVSAVCGAINGVAAASGIGMIGAGFVGGITGGIESMCHKLIDNGGNLSAQDRLEIVSDGIVGFIGGIAGGKGAINNNKYMANQLSRLNSRMMSGSLSDGINGLKYFCKSTSNYSKPYIKSTVFGIGKGWGGSQIAGALFEEALS